MHFCSGDILREGVKLTFWLGAVLSEDFEEALQPRVTQFLPYRFRHSRIAHIESNLILPLRGHCSRLAELDLSISQDAHSTTRRSFTSITHSELGRGGTAERYRLLEL